MTNPSRREPTSSPTSAFVWAWMPGAVEPVVAGHLEAADGVVMFNYGRSYLNRSDAVPIYAPELPLQPGRLRPLPGLSMAGCMRDAAPDAWGQRVILAKHAGHLDRNSDTGDLSMLTYLLESGSDRIGALDFQDSAEVYTARQTSASLEEMQTAAERLEAGIPLSPALDAALLHGTSIGGARPKVLLESSGRHLIAKLSSRTDPYPVVKAEAVAMELARRVGLNVAATELVNSVGRDVLLVERFDRTRLPGQRLMVVSALTMLELDEMMGRYASYPALADLIRRRFTAPVPTLHELFARIVFNICVGNTDDHARNHAAIWDGATLTLSPAFDLCPQLRSGTESNQAIAIGRDGARQSRLSVCLDSAATYQLSTEEAANIIEQQVTVINEQWQDAAELAQLTAVERSLLWHRQILNPYMWFED